MEQQDSSIDRWTQINRRTFLAGTSTGIAGLGVLHSSPVETALAQSASSTIEWPQYRADSGRTGAVADRQAPSTGFTPEWSLTEQTVGQPVVDQVAVYVVTDALTTDNAQLKAVSRTDGSVSWERSLTNEYREPTSRDSTPVLGEGSLYYSNGEQTKAFDVTDGSVEWSSSVGGSWLIHADGFLYIRGTNGAFIVLNAADGSVAWDGIRSGNARFLAPHYCVNNGTLYLGTERRDGNADARIIAVDSRSGKPDWKAKVDAERPEVAANEHGVVVATATDLYGFDQTSGKQRWEINGRPLRFGEARIVSSPVVSGEYVYCTVGDELLKVDINNGSTMWSSQRISRPVLVGEHIYGTDYLSLLTIDSNSGNKVDSYEFGDGRTPSSNQIVPLEERILVGVTEYYEGYEEYPVVGRPLIALGGN